MVEKRTQVLFEAHLQKVYKDTDRLFVGLMLFQWIAGIVIAAVISPKTWLGTVSQTHIHVWAAVFLGGAIAIFPVFLGICMPGHVVTRNVIAVAQMLFSGLLIHLTGGRIETHFHIFGSLAFLAFYRDWKVLVPATIVVAVDHMVRGIFWPESVFGILVASNWRWMEHAAWVLFEDIFLFRSCAQAVAEMKLNAMHMAELEMKNTELLARENELLELTKGLDLKVKQRTEKLEQSNQELLDLHADLRIKQSEVLNLYRSTDKVNKKLKETQAQLVQSEKLASLGHLAAGIAHEINNPVGFISNNMEVFQDYVKNFSKAMEYVDALKKEVSVGNFPEASRIAGEFEQFSKTVDLSFIVDDTCKLLDHSARGLERIKKIVMDLRIFARQDKGEMVESANIEAVIDNILGIVANEVKYKAELVKEYGDTPLLLCNSQRLGQVFINLILNAVQAMETKGKIVIKTYHKDGVVSVDVSDTGCGIAPENLTKIFDPFYTTKSVGLGTGLGLSVSYEIIKQHDGEISVKSTVGQGTTFTVKVPVK